MWCNDFSAIGESYLLRNLDISISNIALIVTLTNIPWYLNVPISYVSDRIGHREIQITACFFYCTVVWAILAFNPQLPATVICVLLGLNELGAATILCVADALLVVAKDHDPNIIVRSTQFRTIGRMMSELVSSFILNETNDIYLIFRLEVLWNAIMTLYCFIFFYWCKTPYAAVSTVDPEIIPTDAAADAATDAAADAIKQNAGRDNGGLLDSIWFTLTTPTSIRNLILFLMFMYAIPDASGANMYYMIGPLGYTPANLGVMAIITNLCSLVGSEFVIRNIRDLARFYATAGNLINIPTLWIVTRVSMVYVDDRIVTYISGALMSIIVSSVQVSFITAASEASKKGHEASAFSIYRSLPLLGNGINVVGTYALTKYLEVNHHNFENLVWLNVICDALFLLTLIPPFFIHV